MMSAVIVRTFVERIDCHRSVFVVATRIDRVSHFEQLVQPCKGGSAIISDTQARK